ncbi:response regulator [Bradyrhizobium sp. USDA 4486]
MTQSLTILVAEDDYQIQEMLEEALTEAGFRPQILSSAEEAATVLKSGVYEFRALVADVNLKGKTSGWDLARLVREPDPEFPVVYMTGMAADEWASLGSAQQHSAHQAVRARPARYRRLAASQQGTGRSLRERVAPASEQGNDRDHGNQTYRGHAPA